VSSGGPAVIYRFNLAAKNEMEIAALGQLDAIDEKLYVREKATGRILEIRRDGTHVPTAATFLKISCAPAGGPMPPAVRARGPGRKTRCRFSSFGSTIVPGTEFPGEK
jgi:hypothetical protein